MLKATKFGIISAAIMALYSSSLMAAIITEIDPEESSDVNLTAVTAPSYYEDAEVQANGNLPQNFSNKSWTEFSKDAIIATAQHTGKKLWDAAAYTVPTALAWNVNYYGMGAVEEAVAYTAYGLGTLGGGPVAGSGAYCAAKGIFKVARYIVPGFEGYIAGVLAPVAKTLVVDPILKNYGPSVVKGVAKAGIEGTKYIANGLSSLYNYDYRSAAVSMANGLSSLYNYKYEPTIVSKVIDASIVPFYSK